MATCNDCIHGDICHNRIHYHADEDEFFGYLLTDKECHCEHFKDASKLVELPCKVGDTVYFLCRNQETYEWYICKEKIYSIEIYENSIHFRISPICRFVEMEIGVRLFLTKEEAERALKEREQE